MHTMFHRPLNLDGHPRRLLLVTRRHPFIRLANDRDLFTRTCNREETSFAAREVLDDTGRDFLVWFELDDEERPRKYDEMQSSAVGRRRHTRKRWIEIEVEGTTKQLAFSAMQNFAQG